MPRLAIEGAELHYEVDGEGPALVLAHGLGGSVLSWWQQVPFFRERWRTITFAHRGFAPSTDAPEPLGPKAFARDLRALLDHLGVGDVRLVGQSMGGHTVMDFALSEPSRVRALVLSGSDGAYEYPELARVQPAIAAAAEAYLAAGVHPAVGIRMAREQPALQWLYERIAQMSATAETRDRVRQGYAQMPAAEPGALARLAMPVLSIRGEEDALFLPEMQASLVGALPRATSAVLPAAGHSPYFERADEWNAIVGAFLDATL